MYVIRHVEGMSESIALLIFCTLKPTGRTIDRNTEPVHQVAKPFKVTQSWHGHFHQQPFKVSYPKSQVCSNSGKKQSQLPKPYAFSPILASHKPTILSSLQAAGGIISASLLSTPGASSFYKGGLTLYTLESRIAYAGWTQENIQNYKGPTPDIVKGLAENVREKLGSTYTICESGTAGPTGGNTRNRTP